MKKTALLLLSATIVLITGCGQGASTNNTNASTQQVASKGIQVPANLLQCDPNTKFFTEMTESGAKDCKEYDTTTVCDYYKLINKGKESTHIIQYTSICAACRFYGKEGKITMGSNQFTDLGYVTGPCNQEMNK
jgi:hypothetical protein